MAAVSAPTWKLARLKAPLFSRKVAVLWPQREIPKGVTVKAKGIFLLDVLFSLN